MPRAASGCPPEHRPLSKDAPWRLRGHANFTRIRTEGRRARRGPITVTFVPALDASPPRVGFAIGRQVGSSVVRNRVRRRLREILRASPPPPGDYLIRVAPGAADLTFSQLRSIVCDACRSAAER